MLPLLSTLSPNAAVLILTLGIALIALELNRPGSIVPGALGLLLSLLAAASLAEHHPASLYALGAAFCVVLLLLQSRRRFSRIVTLGITVALVLYIRGLLPPVPGPEISVWAAVLSGLTMGAGITILTRIARRARQNKGLD